MDWFFLGLIAPAIFAINSFIDKYVLSSKVKDPLVLPIYSAIAAIVIGTGLWLVAGMPVLGGRNGSLLLLSGVFTICALTLYFYALAQKHTSYIIAFLQTTPIFTLLLSLMLFDEGLNMWQLVGFFLTLGAIMGLSADQVRDRFKCDRAVLAIIVANLLFAAAAIAIEFTADLHNFVSILVYQSWGMAFGGVVLLMLVGRMRRAFLYSYKGAGGQTLLIMFINEVLFNIANAMTYLAITLGPVTLVMVLGSMQAFYGLLFGVMLSLTLPKVFGENLARHSITIRAVLTLILATGVTLIAVIST